METMIQPPSRSASCRFKGTRRRPADLRGRGQLSRIGQDRLKTVRVPFPSMDAVAPFSSMDAGGVW